MKNYSKITIGAAAITFTGILIASKRKANAQKITAKIASEGYEIAADILNPTSNSRLKKLHLGPVLPHHIFR
jgi:hypothetical protein